MFQSKAQEYAVISQERKEQADLDWILVQQVQAGQVNQYDLLVKKYREKIYSIIYNLTSNREDAADIAQDVFIKAFQSIHQFRGKSSFFTWLYRIAVNTSITFLKKYRNKTYFSLEVFETEGVSGELAEQLASKIKTDRPTFLKELQEKLNEAMQTLSINHRTVVVLHDVEGLSHQEIATIVGCSEGTVRSRLHYAKQQLQGLLQEYIS